jgi:hypothetical protein
MPRDIRITKQTDGSWDLKRNAGRFEFADEGTAIAQHATIRLLTFKGEYTYGGEFPHRADEGTDWYGIIFNMAKSKVEKEFELKRVILGTPGVTGITQFNWSQSGTTVTIEGIVSTEYGELDISQEIEPL